MRLLGSILGASSVFAAIVAALVACSGGPETGGGSSSSSGASSSGSSSTSSSGASSSTSSTSSTSSSGSSSGATSCAQAGGRCLSGAAGCGTGFYADEGALSCPPSSSGGANQPCCLSSANGKACTGLTPKPSVNAPTKCGREVCGANALFCKTITPGEPGGTATTSCVSSTDECKGCLSCDCLKRTSAAEACTCSEASGVVTLTCAGA